MPILKNTPQFKMKISIHFFSKSTNRKSNLLNMNIMKYLCEMSCQIVFRDVNWKSVHKFSINS